jgi:hypothetical protein
MEAGVIISQSTLENSTKKESRIKTHRGNDSYIGVSSATGINNVQKKIKNASEYIKSGITPPIQDLQ